MKNQYPGFNTLCNIYSGSAEIEKCTFQGCSSAMKFGKSNVTISDCLFEQNNSVFNWTIGNLELTNSTFTNNTYISIGPTLYYAMGSSDTDEYRNFEITNCTFFNNHIFSLAGKSKSTCKLNNNTIILDLDDEDEFRISSEGTVSLIGNIIKADKITTNTGNPNITTENNLFCATDISNELKTGSNILSGSTVFLASKLEDNGGYTPTLRLMYDETEEEESLRFKRKETTPVGDQRNMLRAENTCMGAYEKGSSEIAPTFITTIADTLFLGQKYPITNKEYPIGKNIIIERIKNAVGKDSIVYTHTLYVFPDINRLNYYVTKRGSGDRSGINWENAMNDSSFAYATLNVSDGTTFHIAEGTYHPMYDYRGNEVDDINMCRRVYYTHSLINLIGGYSEQNPSNGPDPSLYKTILSGDMLGNDISEDYPVNSWDNVYNVLLYNVNSKGTIKISGIRFESCGASKGGTDALIRIEGTSSAALEVDKCTFSQTSCGISARSISFKISDCTFEESNNTTYSNFFTVRGSSSSIRNCSFKNNYLYFFTDDLDLELVNNTFSNINVDVNWNSEATSNLKIYNNTFAGQASFGNCTADLVGNIFTDRVQFPKNISVKSSYNIYNNAYKEDIESNFSNTDQLLSNDDLFSILDNDNRTFLYRSNNGSTPSIQIINDQLPNGTSLRFPLHKTICETDQRGVTRLNYTCRGAYEAECFKKETFIDTIRIETIGSKFYGTILPQTGLCQIEQKEKSICDGDSIIYHKVMVMPSLKRNEYFVKKTKTGIGDGSSWENAMNDSMFAYVLANLRNAATFHIAAGTYTPIYDSDKNLDAFVRTRIFLASQSVKLIGGYSESITDETEKPNPVLHKTIFSGDTGGNGDTDDFTFKLLQISPKAAGESEVSGIHFCNHTALYGFEGLLEFTSNEELQNHITIDHCTFTDASVALLADNASATISNSNFTGVGRAFGAYAHPNSIDISSCTFENNGSTSLEAKDELKISNSTVVGGEMNIFASNISLLNNTLLNNLEIMSKVENADLIGNIIEKIGYDQNANINFQHNLSHEKLGGNNILSDDFYDVLDYDSGRKAYMLTDDGHYTKTVTIISDTLFDGTSIKFPISETQVDFDQWGRKRLQNTCMGAYELFGQGCEAVEKTENADTIFVGDYYMDTQYLKEGEYDIIEKQMTELGCDSTIHHILQVICKKIEITLDKADSIQVGTKFLDSTFTETGEYKLVEELKTQWDCDSIVNHTVVVYCQTIENFIEKTDTILVGSSYLDSVYTQEGEFQVAENLKNQYGCDSTVYHNVYVEDIVTCQPVFITLDDNTTIAVGDTLEGIVYDSTGVFTITKTLQKIDGCDSIVQQIVIVEDTITSIICSEVVITQETPDTIYVGSNYLGETYFLPGEFLITENLESSLGCDSSVVHKLIVLSDTGVEDIQAPTYFSGAGELFMPGYEVFIYNLQGGLICHSLNGWDGTNQGRPVSIGVYIYAIFSNPGQMKRGIIELINAK